MKKQEGRFSFERERGGEKIEKRKNWRRERYEE